MLGRCAGQQHCTAEPLCFFPDPRGREPRCGQGARVSSAQKVQLWREALGRSGPLAAPKGLCDPLRSGCSHRLTVSMGRLWAAGCCLCPSQSCALCARETLFCCCAWAPGRRCAWILLFLRSLPSPVYPWEAPGQQSPSPASRSAVQGPLSRNVPGLAAGSGDSEGFPGRLERLVSGDRVKGGVGDSVCGGPGSWVPAGQEMEGAGCQSGMAA